MTDAVKVGKLTKESVWLAKKVRDAVLEAINLGLAPNVAIAVAMASAHFVGDRPEVASRAALAQKETEV